MSSIILLHILSYNLIVNDLLTFLCENGRSQMTQFPKRPESASTSAHVEPTNEFNEAKCQETVRDCLRPFA